MSAVSGLTSKGENKSKQKYQSLNINNLYKGKSLETTKTSVAPKHGLQTLGKVGAGRRMPPPANLPSLKSQTTTNQNITLVPTGGQGWGSGKDEDSGATPPLQTSSTGVDAQPLSAQKPSAGPLNPLMTSSTATTDTNVGAIALGLTSAALTAQSKTWSTITATAEHPESGPEKSFSVQQLPFFPQEFPKLDGGNAPQDATTKPSAEISYGPGPSLRPQTEGSWGRGTLQAPQPGINPNANQSPNAGSAASGQPPSHPNDQNIPQMARGLYPQSGGPLTQRGPMPGAVPIMPAANQTGGPLMPGQQPMNFNQYRMITPYPPHMSYPGQRGAYPTGPFPPQGFTPHGPINTRQPYFPDRAGQRPGEESGGPPGRPAPPIITDKDLKGFDDMLDSGVQKGWAAQNTEVDYNAKIMFSDDENDDSHPNKEPNYDPREVRHSGDGRQKDRERRERDSDRGEERPKSYRSPQQQQWQNQSQNMAPNPRNSNYDNQPQQQHPHHDSQQPYPRSQDRHSQNYPHSRHNRSDHPMADDDEVWRQRSQQQAVEMASAVVRARQRREEEEKRMERSRLAALEKLRMLEEKSGDKPDNEFDKSSRHSSESDKPSNRVPNTYGSAPAFPASKQYPKNVPPRFQKQAELLLRQTQGGGGPQTGPPQPPPFEQRFVHSSARLPSESDPRETRNLANSNQTISKAPPMADKPRSDSHVSSGPGSVDEREPDRKTPDFDAKERRPHRISGSDSNNWRAAQNQRSPQPKESTHTVSTRPLDDKDIDKNQNLQREVPKRTNEDTYSLQKGNEFRDNKPKEDLRDSKEKFIEKPVLAERQLSSQSSRSSSSKEEVRVGRRQPMERLDWAAECDNMPTSIGHRREPNRHRPLPITQKQFESITEPMKRNLTPLKKTSVSSVSSHSEDSKESSVDKTKDFIRKSETPPLNTTGAPNAENVNQMTKTNSADISKAQAIKEESRVESLGIKKERESDRYYDNREKDPLKRDSVKDDRHYRKDRSNSGRYETSSYAGRGAVVGGGGRYAVSSAVPSGPAFRGRGREYRSSQRSEQLSYNDSKVMTSYGNSRNKPIKSRKKSNSDESCVSEDINKKESIKSDNEKSIPTTISDIKADNEKDRSVSSDTIMSGSASVSNQQQRNDISRRGRGLVPFKSSSTRGMPRAYGPSNYGPPPSRAAFGDGSAPKTESNKNYDQNRNERHETRNSNQTRNAYKSANDELNYSSQSDLNQYHDNSRNNMSNARKSGPTSSRGASNANNLSNNNRGETLPPRFQKTRQTKPSEPRRGGRIRPERSGSGNHFESDMANNEEWETASESSDVGDRKANKRNSSATSSSQPKTDNRSHNRKSDVRRGGDYPRRQHTNDTGFREGGGRGGRNRSSGSNVLTTRSPNTNQQRNGTISGSNNINDNNITVCSLSEVTLDNPNAVEEALSDIKNRSKSNDFVDDDNTSETEDGFQTVSYKKRNRLNQGNDSKKFKQELSPKSKATTARTRQSKLAPRFAKQKENSTRLNTITDEAFTSPAKIADDLKALSIDPKTIDTTLKGPKDKAEEATQLKPVVNAWSRPLSHCSQTTTSNSTVTTTTRTTTQTSSSKIQDIHTLSVSSKSSSFDQHDSGIDVSDQPPSTASSQRSSPSNDDNKLTTTTAKVTNPTETRADIVTDIDSAKPMCTVIFENTRFKEENKVLAKIAPAKSPTAKEMFVTTAVTNNVVTEAGRPNPPINVPKKTDAVLMEEFANNDKIQTPNVAKVVGMQRTNVLPTESDLNVKIASTRKVWENPSMPSSIDTANENVKNVLLKSLEVNKIISTESHGNDGNSAVKAVTEASIANKVHYSTVDSINSINKSKTPVLTYTTPPPAPNQMNTQSYVGSHQSQASLISSQQILLNTISSPPLVENMRPVSGVQQSYQVHNMATNPAISTPPTMLYNTHVGAHHNVYQTFGPQMDSLHQTQMPAVMAQFGPQHTSGHYNQHLLQHQQNQLNQANIFMTHQLTQPSATAAAEQFKQLNAVAQHQQTMAKTLPMNQFVQQNNTNIHQTLANSGSWTAATPHNQSNNQSANYYQQSNSMNNVLQAHQQHFAAFPSQASLGLMPAQSSQATAAALAVQQSYRAAPLPIGRNQPVDATNSMAANLRSMFAGNIINDMKIGNQVNQTMDARNVNNRGSFAYNQNTQSLQQLQQQQQQQHMFAANQKFTGRAILPIYAQQMLSQANISGRPNSASMLASNVNSANSYTTPIQRPKVNRNNQSYVKNSHPTHYQNQYQTQPPPQPQLTHQPLLQQQHHQTHQLPPPQPLIPGVPPQQSALSIAQQAKMRQDAVRQTQSFFAQSSVPTTAAAKDEPHLDSKSCGEVAANESLNNTAIADNNTIPAMNDSNKMNIIEKND